MRAPPAWRDTRGPAGRLATEVPQRFYLTIGQGSRCLELHPTELWLQRVERWHAMHDAEDEEAGHYIRDVLSSTVEIYLDRQHRLMVPEALRLAAGIDRQVVFVGTGDRIEIWDAGRWGEHVKTESDDALRDWP